ncbi:hypothetical protein OHB26_33825 [Nocardia sp. NBC_01503]|uniref:AMIN-like domain-containing (lipo)protein n=1 Tax=Nocardia sp. NBC_01503 TaxID=2975997 RepID=UPI002E7B60FA|nr:hypothetical protein [Nocardia sp. NBC_01503]WTL31827.1 hypothetical protein OHB26_33825 [Nocardia sp. NBC_01503]
MAKTVLLVAIPLLLTACGGTSAPPGPRPTTTAAPVDEFVPKTRTPDPAAVGIGLTNISLSATDKADRVTFQFTGAAVPGWAVHYVKQAVSNTSTQSEFPVTGQSIIEVLIREAANPFESGVPPYSGPPIVTDPDLRTIGEVRYASALRGVTQAFIGLATPQRAFRVTALTDPTRIVVEVDHK